MINHEQTTYQSDTVTNLLFSVLLLALRPFFIAEEKFDSDNFYIFFFSFVRFWCLRNRAHVLMTQLDRTLAKSLHCQLGNLRSHVSSSHIVPVTQSKHKSLVPHSLIIQTGSLLVCQGTYLNCKWYQKPLGTFKNYVDRKGWVGGKSNDYAHKVKDIFGRG